MKNLKVQLFLTIAVLLVVGWLWSTNQVKNAEATTACFGFGCYHSIQPQVLGEQIVSPNRGAVGSVCWQGENQVPCPNSGNQNQPLPPQNFNQNQQLFNSQGMMNQPNNQGMMNQSNNQNTNQQQMDQQRQAQQQQQDAQRLKQTKTQMANFMKQVAAAQARASKAKVTIPGTVAQALGDLKSYGDQVNNATDSTPVNDIIMEMNDSMQTVQDFMNMLPTFQQLPQELKKATANYTTYSKAYDKLARQAASAKNLDLSQPLADLKAALDEAKAAINQAQADSKTDPQSVMDTLRNFYDYNLDAVREKQRVVEFSLNINQGLKNFTAMVNNFNTRIKQADKQKLDTTDVKAQLANIKNAFNNLKQTATAKLIDFDNVQNLAADFSQSVNDLNSALDSLLGVSNFNPQISQLPAGQQIYIPSGLNVGGNNNQCPVCNCGNQDQQPLFDGQLSPQPTMPKQPQLFNNQFQQP